MDERQYNGIACRSPVLGCRYRLAVPFGEDRHVGQLECQGDRLGDGRKGHVGSERSLQPLSEARERLVGFVAFAVHQAVYAALEAVA